MARALRCGGRLHVHILPRLAPTRLNTEVAALGWLELARWASRARAEVSAVRKRPRGAGKTDAVTTRGWLLADVGALRARGRLVARVASQFALVLALRASQAGLLVLAIGECADRTFGTLPL